MAIQDFYSRLTSSGDLTPLLAALRRLSLLQDLRAAFASAVEEGTEEEEGEMFKGWAVWDQPANPDAGRRLSAAGA